MRAALLPALCAQCERLRRQRDEALDALAELERRAQGVIADMHRELVEQRDQILRLLAS